MFEKQSFITCLNSDLLILAHCLASSAVQLELTSKSFTFDLSDEIYYLRGGNLTNSPNFILVLFSFTACI